MNTKAPSKNWFSRLLVFFVVINIIGDVGNVAFWWANPDSRAASLNTGYIATSAGVDNALIAGTVILVIVAAIYAVSLVGLWKNRRWGSLLVIAISVANRVLAVLLYFLSAAFAFWAVWTVILVVLAYLNLRNSPMRSQTQQKA
jgi:uncharacterized membrane protein (DUF2068 family)